MALLRSALVLSLSALASAGILELDGSSSNIVFLTDSGVQDTTLNSSSLKLLLGLEAKIDARLAAVDTRLATHDTRFNSSDARFTTIDTRLATIDTTLKSKADVPTSFPTKSPTRYPTASPTKKPTTAPPTVRNINGSVVTVQLSNRQVFVFKVPLAPCASVIGQENFCSNRGMKWFKPQSTDDVNKLADGCRAWDGTHTWIQIYGTGLSSANGMGVGGYPCTTCDDTGVSASAVSGSVNSWGAYRDWGSSWCQSSAYNYASCCWDSSHTYDFFPCE